MLDIKCPHCKKPTEVTKSEAGEVTKCPHCAKGIKVPTVSEFLRAKESATVTEAILVLVGTLGAGGDILLLVMGNSYERICGMGGIISSVFVFAISHVLRYLRRITAALEFQVE